MVKLYLVRHAIAVSRGTAGCSDDDRPLTEEGIEKMTAAAAGLSELIPQIDAIITSPLKRAYETAKIIAKGTNYKQEVETTKTLLPGCTAKNLINYLVKYKDKGNIVVVGHEPDFGMIAASLIGAGSSAIEFKKGALCKIELDGLPPKQPGRLILLLQPKILRLLGKNKKINHR